jgi:Ankyrin repeats (many copies)/Ankyrin repeats (3 copies)
MDDELYAALLGAVDWGVDIEEVRGVLCAGANPNYTPPDRNSRDYHPPVLHHAHSEEKVRCLVTEGHCDVNILGSCGSTALIGASGRPNRLKVVAALLDLRADPNIVCDGGESALSEAADYASSEMVTLLLEHGAVMNPAYGAKSPLCSALESRRPNRDAIVRTLLEHGADPNTGALHVAAESGKVEAMQALLDFRADPNLRNEGDFTPLHVAVLRDEWAAVELLLSHGADLFAQVPYGDTPLELADPQLAARLRPLVAERLVQAFEPTGWGACLPTGFASRMIEPHVARP